MADKLVTLQDENKTPIYPESRASVVKTSDGKTVEDALAEKQPVGSYLTEESDPTVPSWAKEPEKPAYTAEEVGAIAIGGLKTVNGNSLEGSGDIVIEAGGTQYLDLSMFSEESGTLSDEDYQKVVKAYDDGVSIVKKTNVNLGNEFAYYYGCPIIDAGDNYVFLGSGRANLLGCDYIIVSFSVIKEDKSYAYLERTFIFEKDGSGTKALTDNGQYAEFAKPTKVKSGGSGSVTKQLSPNTLYKFGACSKLTITFAAEESGILNEYMFEFVNGSSPTTLSLPDSVKWSGGNAPTIEANKTYQVSIVNNLAVYASF